MFDTNIFNAILEGNINFTQFPKQIRLFVTHIQRDEIEAISNPDKLERKQKLLQIFNNIEQEKIPTESAIYGVSKYGEAKYAREDTLIKELTGGKKKHVKDALIGETAIRRNIILVTDDQQLRDRVNTIEGKAISFEQFIKQRC